MSFPISDSSTNNLIVTVVVPCLNEKNYINSFLNNIKRQIFDFKLELIISDGGSNDGTVEFLKNFYTDRFYYKYILHNEKFVSLLNKAILESKGSIIIRMDVHTEYDKNYLSNCVNVLQSNNVQCVGGPCELVPRILCKNLLHLHFNLN